MFNNLNQKQQNQENVSIDINQSNNSSKQSTNPLLQSSAQNKVEDIFNETDKVKNIQQYNSAVSAENDVQKNNYQNQNKFWVIIIAVAIIAVIFLIAWLVINKFSDQNSNPIHITAPQQQNLDIEIDESLDFNNNTQIEQSSQQASQAQATSSVESIEQTQLIKKNIDTDKDGLTDEQEKELGTDIHSADTDNDKLFDREEIEVYKTDPLNFDTDGDGYLDGDEVKAGYNPKGEGKLYEIK